jgi:hypothetical protein
MDLNSGVTLSLKRGSLGAFEPNGYAPKLSVGNGALDMVDPIARTYPLIKVLAPKQGDTIIEVKYKPR